MVKCIFYCSTNYILIVVLMEWWPLKCVYIADTKNMSRKVSSCIYMLILYFFVMQFTIVVDAVTDSLSAGQVIKPSETLVSAGKIFELGFFRPGQSRNYHVGIWYKNIPEQTVVWVANRDLPLTSLSPIITINDEGNLVIIDGKITYRVSDVALRQNTSAILLLLDSGNLVLRNGNSDILWQSFDYPSNTFLPGMKFGYSRKDGKVWSFTSWKSEDNPSRGDTEMKMDEKSNQFFLTKSSQVVWTSGVWSNSFFSRIPEMMLNHIFNYNFFSDQNETYFTYSRKDSAFCKFQIYSGQIQQMAWSEDRQEWLLLWAQPRICGLSCGPFSICNPNIESLCECLYGFVPLDSGERKGQVGGCLRRTALQCENSTSVNGSEQRFLRVDGLGGFAYSPKVWKVGAKEECEFACLNNCSCTAYAPFGRDRCFLWYGEILNLERNHTGGPTYIKLAASEFQKPGGNRKLLWITATVVPLALTALYIFFRWRKLKEKGELEAGEDMLLFDMNISTKTNKKEQSEGGEGKGKSKDTRLPLFSFASVSASTDNFSTENKLGEGGFGPVYKGKLLNGQEVAVKRLSKKSGQGLEELKNETMLIAKLQHRNLVRILGCCLEQGENILIYEYMPNKSLDFFLFDPIKKDSFGLETRVKIIDGIAQGLIYLHQYSRLRIIHRDLKASNILLDSDMNPKISDFGMARMFGGDELQANTSRIVGTYGYMSPEYALEGLFSIKSDVFSFGVLLLEILSSKKNTGFYNTGSLNLVGYAWDLWKDDRELDLVDPILQKEGSYLMLIRYINVALLCVQESAADRPTMSEVVAMLTNQHLALPSPKQPAFSYMRSSQNSNPHQNRPEACSANDVTLSVMEAR